MTENVTVDAEQLLEEDTVLLLLPHNCESNFCI
jgi:hypothetical protein